MGIRGLEPSPIEGPLQGSQGKDAPYQVFKVEKALCVLFQDAQEDQEQTGKARQEPALAAGKTERGTGRTGKAAQAANARTLRRAQGYHHKDIRPAT